MGRIDKISVFVIALLLSVSCSKNNPGDCFKSAGTITSETRTAVPFTDLHMTNNVDVFLSYAPTYSIEVRAGKNVIPGIKTEISDSTLTISNENSCNWIRSYNSPVEVYLEAPQLDSIFYAASGNLTSVNQFTNNSLVLEVLEGSGSISLWLNTEKSWMNLHYGTADLSAKGYSHISYLSSGGYGPADLSKLNTEFTFMTNNSTNICRVKANLQLHVNIFNVGDVYYSGDPAEISPYFTSTGRLYKE